MSLACLICGLSVCAWAWLGADRHATPQVRREKPWHGENVKGTVGDVCSHIYEEVVECV